MYLFNMSWVAHHSSLNFVFKVTHWPKEDYGKFYDGDSFIILNTYKNKESDEVHYI